MSAAARKVIDVPDAPEEFRPRSEFARLLWEIRLRIEAQGGGSKVAGLVKVFFRWSINAGVLLALLYALVWFIQRVWNA